MQSDRKQLARAALAARRRRIALIRRRVLTFTALLFVMLWMVICAQIVLGRDPALSTKHRVGTATAHVRARKTKPATPPRSTPVDAAPAATPSPTPVVTSQS